MPRLQRRHSVPMVPVISCSFPFVGLKRSAQKYSLLKPIDRPEPSWRHDLHLSILGLCVFQVSASKDARHACSFRMMSRSTAGTMMRRMRIRMRIRMMSMVMVMMMVMTMMIEIMVMMMMMMVTMKMMVVTR